MAISMTGVAKPAATPQQSSSAGGSMSFLKTGAAAKQAHSDENAKTAAKMAAASKMRRFYIGKNDIGKDFKITFLDGSLDEDGSLEAPTWHEHFLEVAGNWGSYPCTAHEEPCPICGINNEPALVSAFTIIDHQEYTVQKGPNAGKTFKDQRRLYVVKRTTFALLQKLASKQGGLVGCTFEVSRQGEKSPNAGDLFQFEEKRTLKQLKGIYGDEAEPANIAEEIVYHSRKELLQLGIGKGASGPGVGSGNKPSADLDAELGG